MYLSRIMLDTKKRKTMYALNSPSIIHGMVEKSFCGVRQRNLWRLDNLAGAAAAFADMGVHHAPERRIGV